MAKTLINAEDYLAFLTGVTNPKEGRKGLTVNTICRGYSVLDVVVDERLREQVRAGIDAAVAAAEKLSDVPMGNYVCISRCVMGLPRSSELIATPEVTRMLELYVQLAK